MLLKGLKGLRQKRRCGMAGRTFPAASELSVILVLVMIAFSRSASAAPTGPIPGMIGYSVKIMADVDSRDIEAAFRVWSQELAAQYGFHIETVLYDSTDKLAADFLAKKIDFAVVTSIEFLRAAKTLKVKPEVTQYRNGKSFVRFLVLADAADMKKGLAGLKNKKLSVPKGNALATMFLDTQLMKSGLLPSASFFSVIQEKTRESQAILDVFFGHSNACVVSDTVFSTMKEMNPQIGRKLQIMAESPELIASIGFFRPDWPGEYKKKAIEAMKSDTFRRHERAKQIMLLFNIEKIDVIADDQLESTRKLLVDYDRLKRKNK